MTERDTIHPNAAPVTLTSLQADLEALGVRSGMTLLVHSSLSALGWVSGGAQAVVMALEATLGPWGTLVMPTHSTGLSEPSYWQHPPVPESWWPVIRETMPAFDVDLSPSLRMGAIPECFRKQPGTLRSYHPHSSFAARGAQAETITANHALDYSLGDHSPLGRLYELDAWVLLLGVGHDRNTSLHLAECRAEHPGKRVIRQGGPVAADGLRTWATFDEWEYDDEDFPAIGADFSGTGLVTAGRVGAAESLLMPQSALVDFAVRWMSTHRKH